jgi:hypothetical protein
MRDLARAGIGTASYDSIEASATFQVARIELSLLAKTLIIRAGWRHAKATIKPSVYGTCVRKWAAHYKPTH